MEGPWGGYARLDWPEPDPRRAWPVPAAPAPPPRADPVRPPPPPPGRAPDPAPPRRPALTARCPQDIPVYIPQKTMPELPLAYGGGQHTLRDAPKKGPPPPAPPAPPAPPPPAESSDAPSKQKVSSRSINSNTY